MTLLKVLNNGMKNLLLILALFNVGCASFMDSLDAFNGVPDFFYISSNIKCPIDHQISFSYPTATESREVITFSIPPKKCETFDDFSGVQGGLYMATYGETYLVGKATSKSTVTGEEFTLVSTNRAFNQITSNFYQVFNLTFADFIEKTVVNICENNSNSKCLLKKSESLCWYDGQRERDFFPAERCGELVRNHDEDKALFYYNIKQLQQDFPNLGLQKNCRFAVLQGSPCRDPEKKVSKTPPKYRFNEFIPNVFSLPLSYSIPSKKIVNEPLGGQQTTFVGTNEKNPEIEKPETKLFLSCEVVDRGRTKLERYDNGFQAFDFGNTTLITKKNIFQRVPDKEKFPIYLDIKNSDVSIEASGDLEDSYRNVNFSGKLITETESSFYIEAERRWGEKWEININRNTGTINIKPKGFIGILDAIERLDDDKPIRILEGYCEARPKRKF